MNPTPTPFPVWPTPTMIPTSAATPVFQVPAGLEYMVAENFVQGYQHANQAGALDMIMFAILFLLIVGGTWSILKKLQQT